MIGEGHSQPRDFKIYSDEIGRNSIILSVLITKQKKMSEQDFNKVLPPFKEESTWPMLTMLAVIYGLPTLIYFLL